MKHYVGLFILLGICMARATEIENISLPLIPDLDRADIYMLRVTENPIAVLVLCPGCNESGKAWVENPLWQQFARDHSLDLIGISFASPVALLTSGRGYYYPEQGSGRLLLNGVDQAFHQELPLILYGFSGGAHFTAGFTDWKPERVVAWCAYSAEWWSKPLKSKSNPPGLVICGENDERLGASLIYFEEGRALGKPWLWITAPQTGHSVFVPAESFIRDYFAANLNSKIKITSPPGMWIDLDLKKAAQQGTVLNQPTATGWLPDSKLFTEWQSIHHP